MSLVRATELGMELRRVAVANDSLDGMDRALEKAARIEHYSGAEILVVEALYDPIAEEPPEVLPREEQARLMEALKAAERQGLERLAAPLRQRVAGIDTRLIWAKDAAAGLIEAVSHWAAQLVIKPVSRHHPIADYLHTPLDWALMRDAPCPVLVSKGPSWQNPRRVLAAVDAGDERHAALSREILRTASALAAVLGTELHVVTAYPDLGQQVSDLQVAPDFEGIKKDMRDARSRTLETMIRTLDIRVAEVHVLEGKPTHVIPALAERLDATVTVLGTAARRALGKLVFGNTSEDLIGRLGGDLVTVHAPWS